MPFFHKSIVWQAIETIMIVGSVIAFLKQLDEMKRKLDDLEAKRLTKDKALQSSQAEKVNEGVEIDDPYDSPWGETAGKPTGFLASIEDAMPAIDDTTKSV
jgi:hypothetical protein